jgi:hypothetical protein
MAIGFAGGYYLGAMAGRERYEQMNELFRKVRGSDTFEDFTHKARAAVDLGVERARDAVESRAGNGRNGATDTSTYASSR